MMNSFYRGVVFVLAILFVGQTASPRNVQRIMLNEQEKLDYLAYQLGLFEESEQTAVSEAIKALIDYKALASVGLGLPLGMLGGYIANWLIQQWGYRETDQHVYLNTNSFKPLARFISSAPSARQDVQVTSMLLMPILLYAIMTFLKKSLQTDVAFYNNKLNDFLKHWQRHRYHVPTSLEPLFQELHQQYLVSGRRLACDDVLVKELIKKIAQLCINPEALASLNQDGDTTSNGISVNVMVNDDRDYQTVGYGDTVVR